MVWEPTSATISRRGRSRGGPARRGTVARLGSPQRARAASTRTSAQETAPGQTDSSAALARATTSKASLGRERLISTVRSGAVEEEVQSGETSTEAWTTTEASQPLTGTGRQARRRRTTHCNHDLDEDFAALLALYDELALYVERATCSGECFKGG